MTNNFGDEIGTDPLNIALVLGLMAAFVGFLLVYRWYSRRSTERQHHAE